MASDAEQLVNELLEADDRKKIVPKFESLDEVVDYFDKKMTGDKERLRLKAENALEEALCYYKSGNFDAASKIVITYKGQPAVDTGGILRQFYTDVFAQMVTGMEDIPPLFEGNDRRKLPIYSAAAVLSGLYEILGKIMAHALCLCGSGFGYCSPAVYKFIVTGDISEVTNSISPEDVFNLYIKDYIKKVCFLIISVNSAGRLLFRKNFFLQVPLYLYFVCSSIK